MPHCSPQSCVGTGADNDIIEHFCQRLSLLCTEYSAYSTGRATISDLSSIALGFTKGRSAVANVRWHQDRGELPAPISPGFVSRQLIHGILMSQACAFGCCASRHRHPSSNLRITAFCLEVLCRSPTQWPFLELGLILPPSLHLLSGGRVPSY